MASKKHRKKLKRIHHKNNIFKLLAKVNPSNSSIMWRQASGRGLRGTIDGVRQLGIHSNEAKKSLIELAKASQTCDFIHLEMNSGGGSV
jgi:adenosine/AMP kinase